MSCPSRLEVSANNVTGFPVPQGCYMKAVESLYRLRRSTEWFVTSKIRGIPTAITPTVALEQRRLLRHKVQRPVGFVWRSPPLVHTVWTNGDARRKSGESPATGFQSSLGKGRATGDGAGQITTDGARLRVPIRFFKSCPSCHPRPCQTQSPPMAKPVDPDF